MAKAVRRCFRKEPSGKYTVGKICNPLGARKKYASGIASKKKKLGATRRQMEAIRSGKSVKVGKVSRTRKDGKSDKRFK